MNMKNKYLKLPLCFILSIVLIITLIPTITFADSGSREITGFEPLKNTECYFDGDPTEKELVEGLPDSINVHFGGSDYATPLDVTWEVVEDFEKDNALYFYSLKPVWDDCYVLSEELNELWDVPWITVYRLPNDDAKVEEAEPEVEEIAETPEAELEPIYTEEEGSLDLAWIFGESSYAASISTTDKVYKYLTETVGLNRAAACGVMVNIYAESGMRSNNLENKYNKSFGMTDKQYTDAVDKGKGKYKRPGKKGWYYFNKDYCGYGLCQWTSLGRRAKLLSKALEKGVSISDVDMQLEFMIEELQKSYPAVWKTLQSVPDNPTGAYLAAQHFCLAYEIPANTVAVSASRGKAALTGYWRTYSGNAANPTAKSYLGLCGYSYPGAVKKGRGVAVSGYVVSNYKITEVVATIADSKGKAVYTKSVKPRATAYNLYRLDRYMKFSKLNPGRYTYTIYAKDETGRTITVKHAFNVGTTGSTVTQRGFATSDIVDGDVPSGSNNSGTVDNSNNSGAADNSNNSGAAGNSNSPGTTNGTDTAGDSDTAAAQPESKIKLTSYTSPKTLKVGRGFPVKGRVRSNYKLKKVTVGVYTKSGKKRLEASRKPKTKTFRLKRLDSKLRFGKLKKGTYYYKVVATDEKQTVTLLNKRFRVK